MSDAAIVGAGYVGIPLAQVFAEAGMSVVLVDVDADRVAALNRGELHRGRILGRARTLVESGAITATTDYDQLREADAILIALPTPLSINREPDLSIVLGAAEEIAKRLRRGPRRSRVHHVSRDDAGGGAAGLAATGLEVGKDFHLAFSPERVDPGRTDWTTKTTPKIVGGVTDSCKDAACALYERAMDQVIAVSSPEAAELTKLLENIFRSVNIALVNELAQLCDRMGVDVWEVVDAAATKPFGFMSFKPGPGLGGHCLPVDPFYLSWKAREYDFYTEFIELAGKISDENMPYFCLDKITRALNSVEKVGEGQQRAPRRRFLQGRRRRSYGSRPPSSSSSSYATRGRGLLPRPAYPGASRVWAGVGLARRGAGGADCVAIVTAHSGIDYEDLAARARLVVDFRNATGANGSLNGRVWKL